MELPTISADIGMITSTGIYHSPGGQYRATERDLFFRARSGAARAPLATPARLARPPERQPVAYDARCHLQKSLPSFPQLKSSTPPRQSHRWYFQLLTNNIPTIATHYGPPMSKENTTPDSTIDTAIPLTWLEQFVAALKWAEDHPVKFASGAIALPTLSIFYYLHENHLPLSILSSDVISSLPSLLTLISALTLSLFALTLMPIIFIFDGANTEQDGSIRSLISSGNTRLANSFIWLAALMLPGAILAIAVVLMTKYDGNDAWAIPLSVILASSTFALILYALGKRRPFIKYVLESSTLAFCSNLAQMLLTLTLMKQALRFFPDLKCLCLILLILLATVATIAIVQILLVHAIELGSKKGRIAANAFYVSIALVSAACLFPTTGSHLAGIALSNSASGGWECVHLSISGEPRDYSEIMEPTGIQTKPVHIFAATSSRYYIRLEGESDRTHMISSERVTQIKKCPTDSSKKEET